MANEFAEFQISQQSKQNANGYLNLFKHIKENQNFFKTYFKLEEISISPITQYNIDLATKLYDNQFIDYHIEFFRAGLNAIIKKMVK